MTMTMAKVMKAEVCADRSADADADVFDRVYRLLEERGAGRTADALRAEVAQLRDRAVVAEGLLDRVQKYAREDHARTPGSTRLARVLNEVRDLLWWRNGPAAGPDVRIVADATVPPGKALIVVDGKTVGEIHGLPEAGGR